MSLAANETADQGEGDRSRHALGNNLRRARLSRGLSLRSLAEITGLSKALLSQIERAEGNPTIGVIGRLADALDHSVSDLIRDTAFAPTVVRFERAEMVTQVHVRTLFASLERRRFELAEGVIPPHTRSAKLSHGTGSMEYAVVLEGVASVQSNGWEVEISEGDAIRFSAEFDHVYATGDRLVRLLTIVTLGDD